MFRTSYPYINESERMFYEKTAVIDVFTNYIEQKKLETNNEIYEKQYAFILHKNHYKEDLGKNYIEEITLEPIPIQIIKYETPKPYQPMHKYSLKERLKVLFKGHI